MVKGAGTSVNRTYTVFDVGERYLSVGLVPKFGGDRGVCPYLCPTGPNSAKISFAASAPAGGSLPALHN